MKNRLLLLLIALLFNGLTVSAQSWLWGTVGLVPPNGSGPGDETPSPVCDAAGNSYLTGEFGDTLIMGTNYLASPTGVSIYIAKYDSNGNLLWAHQSFNTPNSYSRSFGTAVTTDVFGNAYITGFFEDTISFGLYTLYSSTAATTPFLVKYDANGNVQWAKQATIMSPSDNAFSYSVVADKSGNTIIAGSFKDMISFGSKTLATKSWGIFYAKYDANGNVIWANQPTINNTNGAESPFSIATDKFKNIYVTGYFYDTVKFGATALAVPANQETEVFLAKLDSNGNSLWATQSVSNNISQNTFENIGYNVALDKSGYVYITGTFYDTVNFGSHQLATKKLQSIYFVKYDTNGNVLWAKTPTALDNSAKGYWAGYDIAIDTNNNVYLSGGEMGFGTGDGFKIAFGTDTISLDTGTQDGNSVLVKFDTSGQALCGAGIAVGGDDQNGVAVTPNGKCVFFGGDLFGAVRFGPDSLPFHLGEMPFIARWKPCSGCDLAIISSSPSQSVCSGQSINLTASGGTNYSWSPSTGLSNTTGSSVVATPTATITYTVTSGSGSCMSTDTIVLIVIPSPNKPTFTQDGDTLISSSKYDNQWYRNDSLLTNDTTQDFIITVLGEYWVVVNNEANGCSTASDSMDVSTVNTGINQLSATNNQLSFYPNPTNGEINIVSSKNIDDLKITNLLGQLIYESQPKQTQFTFELKDEGMYFVTVTSDSQTETKKVLVIK